MSIALESGPGRGEPGFGRAPRCAYVASPAAAGSAACSSSSVGRNSDSSAEEEEGEGEVQSSYKGPLDTMDALQDALPLRQGISKFYNGKSRSFAILADVVYSSGSARNHAKPENPSPRKRKSLLGALSLKWDKSQNKEMSTGDRITDGPVSCSGRTSSPAATSSSGSNSSSSSSEDDHERSRNLPPRRPHRGRSVASPVFASPPAPSPRQLFSVPMRSLSMVDLLQDVAESTALVSPRGKRRKNWQKS